MSSRSCKMYSCQTHRLKNLCCYTCLWLHTAQGLALKDNGVQGSGSGVHIPFYPGPAKELSPVSLQLRWLILSQSKRKTILSTHYGCTPETESSVCGSCHIFSFAAFERNLLSQEDHSSSIPRMWPGPAILLRPLEHL